MYQFFAAYSNKNHFVNMLLGLNTIFKIYFPMYSRHALVGSFLTHCGLVTPYGDSDPGQHWLRYWLVSWRHQAITWTNVDLSSLRSNDVHLRAISLEISVTKISLNFFFFFSFLFHWNLPGAKELTRGISTPGRQNVAENKIICKICRLTRLSPTVGWLKWPSI